MKKLVNGVLWAIGIAGTFLVSEGLLTGEELTAIQNITGIAMGGGAITFGMIIAIINAIPKQLVTAGYEKAVEKYGQTQVDNVFNKFDEFLDLLHTVDSKLDNIESHLNEDRELRNELFNEG